MTNNGKGSARRGTSKEEMKKFEDNYDDIFRKPRKKAVVEKIEVIQLDEEGLKSAEELSQAIRNRRSETPKES